MTPATLSALKIGERVRDTNPDCPRKGTITDKPDPDAIQVKWDGGTSDFIYADDDRGTNDWGGNLRDTLEPDDGTPLPEPAGKMFASVPVEGPPYIRPLKPPMVHAPTPGTKPAPKPAKPAANGKPAGVRKTVVIEFVAVDGKNQSEKREEIRVALNDPESDLHRALKSLGWSGNLNAVAPTVSNPKRTAHWPV